jgi:hypothetical protein
MGCSLHISTPTPLVAPRLDVVCRAASATGTCFRSWKRSLNFDDLVEDLIIDIQRLSVPLPKCPSWAKLQNQSVAPHHDDASCAQSAHDRRRLLQVPPPAKAGQDEHPSPPVSTPFLSANMLLATQAHSLFSVSITSIFQMYKFKACQPSS